MKTAFLAFLMTVSIGTSVFAADKVCFGAKDSELTSGIVLKARITKNQVILKAIKGEFRYEGSYSAYHLNDNRDNGKIYLIYRGEMRRSYQEHILIEDNLLEASTRGHLEIRKDGDLVAPIIFTCQDAR